MIASLLLRPLTDLQKQNTATLLNLPEESTEVQKVLVTVMKMDSDDDGILQTIAKLICSFVDYLFGSDDEGKAILAKKIETLSLTNGIPISFFPDKVRVLSPSKTSAMDETVETLLKIIQMCAPDDYQISAQKTANYFFNENKESSEIAQQLDLFFKAIKDGEYINLNDFQNLIGTNSSEHLVSSLALKFRSLLMEKHGIDSPFFSIEISEKLKNDLMSNQGLHFSKDYIEGIINSLEEITHTVEGSLDQLIGTNPRKAELKKFYLKYILPLGLNTAILSFLEIPHRKKEQQRIEKTEELAKELVHYYTPGKKPTWNSLLSEEDKEELESLHDTHTEWSEQSLTACLEANAEVKAKLIKSVNDHFQREEIKNTIKQVLPVGNWASFIPETSRIILNSNEIAKLEADLQKTKEEAGIENEESFLQYQESLNQSIASMRQELLKERLKSDPLYLTAIQSLLIKGLSEKASLPARNILQKMFMHNQLNSRDIPTDLLEQCTTSLNPLQWKSFVTFSTRLAIGENIEKITKEGKAELAHALWADHIVTTLHSMRSAFEENKRIDARDIQILRAFHKSK